MTLLTPVQPGRRSELRLMLIMMAVEAAAELDPVERVFPLGDVALRAFQSCVLALERILRGPVGLQVELGGLPAIDVVTRFASAPIFSLQELPVVFVFVAIHAAGEWQRLFEVTFGVTSGALHRLMFSFQGILRFGVIEVLL